MARARTAPFDEASWLRLDPAAGETLRAALGRSLLEAMREGALRPGGRLPSSRRLAAQLGASRGVVSDAYEQLAAQGYVDVRSRSAPVVAAVAVPVDTPRAAPEPAAQPRWDLTAATPDVTLFPMRRWVSALRHAAAYAPARALDYAEPRGDAGLRAMLADHLGRNRGVVADPERVVVVQGTAQGLELVLRSLEGGRVAVEDPSLEGLHRRVAALGLTAVPAPVDAAGVVVAGVDADALLVTPAHQFPTGVVLSGERRRELLAWAQSANRYVLEDDYDAEFRYDREPVRALQGLDPHRVVYLGTASKTLAPALRLGWVVVPDALVDGVARAKLLADFCSPVLDQLALRRLLETGAYDRHVRRVRTVYRTRRDTLVAALAERLPDLPVEGVAAGLHVFLALPPGTEDAAVAREATRFGLRVEPASRYRLTPGPPAIVLGYGRVHESALGPAVDALARAIDASI